VLDRVIGFDEGDARGKLHEQLESFLAAHTGSADLGLRLRGEQLAAGVRFLRLVREGAYDLVVGNPPYQGTAKLADSAYVEKQYPLGKADLFAVFLQRGLELVRDGGVSALLTMRNWMFLKQYAKLRMWLLGTYDLRALGDFDRGGFEDILDEVVSVAVSIFRKSGTSSLASTASQPTALDDHSRDGERTQRKRAATVCQIGRHEFDAAALDVVPESPLVYWWSTHALSLYASTPKLGDIASVRQGMATGQNLRFLRFFWEVGHGCLLKCPISDVLEQLPRDRWVPYIKGAGGRAWQAPLHEVLRWHPNALEVKTMEFDGEQSSRPQNEEFYFRAGIAFTSTGAAFQARAHRYRSVFDVKGQSVFPEHVDEVVAAMNSTYSRAILESLNPSISFQVGDALRLPVRRDPLAARVLSQVGSAFTAHESHREPSVEFQSPGPSPWKHAQAWAQLAVDRPESTPLPDYTEQLTPEPNTDHLSFALGVALGRFAPPSSPKLGILDPSKDPVTHALPDGILFLDGTLEPDDTLDSLGHPSTVLLRDTWQTHRPEDSKRTDLREYLRLDFFADVHRQMYENRPIHWPLSSDKKTFVAWINIHRWHAGTLRTLLANHLNPTKKRLESQLADLREARHSKDPKAARAAEKLLPKLEKLDAELAQFIAEISRCSEQCPPPADPKSPKRERDAVYEPDLDDGVMINAAALWPLLLPQWKDPKKWWKELSEAKGRKDHDWSHLAARYFPERVDLKCQQDPSLGVAHRCFWKYHPARAYAWELRLQDEIEPEFTIDEDWSARDRNAPRPRNANEARAAFLSDHATEANEIASEETKRRKRKLDKAQADRESAVLHPDPFDDAEPVDDGEPDEPDDV
jgi:hypothetical protein